MKTGRTIDPPGSQPIMRDQQKHKEGEGKI